MCSLSCFGEFHTQVMFPVPASVPKRSRSEGSSAANSVATGSISSLSSGVVSGVASSTSSGDVVTSGAASLTSVPGVGPPAFDSTPVPLNLGSQRSSTTGKGRDRGGTAMV